MTRFASISRLAFVFLSCCADPAPPAADPADVERLIASMERRPAGDSGPALPASVEQKIESADRIAGTLVKVEPKRIDPRAAAALIAR